MNPHNRNLLSSRNFDNRNSTYYVEIAIIFVLLLTAEPITDFLLFLFDWIFK